LILHQLAEQANAIRSLVTHSHAYFDCRFLANILREGFSSAKRSDTSIWNTSNDSDCGWSWNHAIGNNNEPHRDLPSDSTATPVKWPEAQPLPYPGQFHLTAHIKHDALSMRKCWPGQAYLGTIGGPQFYWEGHANHIQGHLRERRLASRCIVIRQSPDAQQSSAVSGKGGITRTANKTFLTPRPGGVSGAEIMSSGSISAMPLSELVQQALSMTLIDRNFERMNGGRRISIGTLSANLHV
jgi:hypothetical protein